MTTWHRFTASTDDDSECRNAGCGVVVSDEALSTFAVRCPAPPCTALGQEGEPCVFVPGPVRPVCSYCERTGHLDDDRDDEDDEDMAEAA